MSSYILELVLFRNWMGDVLELSFQGRGQELLDWELSSGIFYNFFHMKISKDYPSELSMVSSWGRMLHLFTQRHVNSMSVSAFVLAHMCMSHVHALKVALRHQPPAFFSPPGLCLVSIAVIGSGLGKREPSHFQLLTWWVRNGRSHAHQHSREENRRSSRVQEQAAAWVSVLPGFFSFKASPQKGLLCWAPPLFSLLPSAAGWTQVTLQATALITVLSNGLFHFHLKLT